MRAGQACLGKVRRDDGGAGGIGNLEGERD